MTNHMRKPKFYDVVILMSDPQTGATTYKTMRVDSEILEPNANTDASVERLSNSTNRAIRLFWATLSKLNKEIAEGTYLHPVDERPLPIVQRCAKHGTLKFHFYRDGIDKEGRTRYRSQCPICKKELWKDYKKEKRDAS